MSDRPTLERLALHVVRMELARPWSSPIAEMREREVVLVEAVVDGVTGWGECCAQPDPTYSHEYVEGAVDVLRRHLLPRALAAPSAEPAVLDRALRPVKGHPMARAAVSSAVLDAVLRLRGVRLVDHLAAISTVVPAGWAPPASVPAGVAVGSGPSTGAVATGGWPSTTSTTSGSVTAVVDECLERVAEGYRRLKLKIHPGWDAEPVAAVRAAVGDGVGLQVDANGSYADAVAPGFTATAGALDRLRPLDALGLLCIEQPLGDDDLLGHAELAAGLVTPICLDESLTSPEATATALALGACRVVNVKPGRLGGLGAAVAVHDMCARAQVALWCGGMLESGVGRAANLALAALPGFTLPGDLSAAARYWREDIVTEPAVLGPGGRIAVPTGPGAGVTVRDDLGDRVVWTATPGRGG